MVLQQQITTCFYVDDDSDDRLFFQEAIDAIGESVRLFELGDDMIYMLKNPPPKPAIVFLDLNMPVKNGFEVLEEIRASEDFQDIPIVVYSTASSIDIMRKCLTLGANYYITKATSLSHLKKAIEHVMAFDWQNFTPTIQNFVYKPAKQ
jgi:CheY-like chemotaxis protein